VFKRAIGMLVLVLGITSSESFSLRASRHLSLALPPKTTHATPLLSARSKDSCLGNAHHRFFSQLFHSLANGEASNERPRIRLLRRAWSQISARIKKAKRTVMILWVALTVLCISANSAAAVPSGGRMGGSFRPSSSFSAPSSHRGIHGPLRNGPLPPTGLYMRSNSLSEMEELPGTPVQQHASPSGKSVKVVDPVTYYCALTGVYGLGVYRMRRSGKSDGRVSALGSGASVLRVSVALDVSNRDDENSILSRLRRISADAETSSRKGVQELVSEVALEVLRQRDAVTAACSSYMHCSGSSHADIEFRRMSTYERAKFGKETVNVFNGVKVIEPADERMADGQATSAIVSILVSIEGDKTNVPKIVSRRDLENALLRIAADSQVEDCLLQAEVLWSPEDKKTVLSNHDIVESYPELAVV